MKSSGRYIKQDGGERIIQPLLYQTNNQGKWYVRDDVLNTTMPALNTAAEYEWRHYDIPVVVPFTDTIKNAGDPRVLSLVAIGIEGTEMSMADDMGTGLFSSGSNSKQLDGLRLAVATTSTVGGISQSTYSWWQAQVDSTTTLLSIPAIRNIISECTIDKKRPSILVGDRDMFERICDLMQPAQRFTDEKTANAGFENVLVAGIPMVIDSHCPSTNLYALGEEWLKMFFSPGDDFKLLPFQMPINQRVMVARLGWSGNMAYNNLRMLGVLSGITA